MLPYIIVACSLWVCADVPLTQLNSVTECVTAAAEADRSLRAIIQDRDVRIVCMSREIYFLTAKIPRLPK